VTTGRDTTEKTVGSDENTWQFGAPKRYLCLVTVAICRHLFRRPISSPSYPSQTYNLHARLHGLQRLPATKGVLTFRYNAQDRQSADERMTIPGHVFAVVNSGFHVR
jgi:hypothetical protein